MSIALGEGKSLKKMNVREAINASLALAKLGLKEIGENQRKAVEAYVGGRDVLMVVPTGSGKRLTFHIAPCVLDFYKHAWRTRSCRHSRALLFSFGFINERPSVDPLRERGESHCFGLRDFRDRKQRSFRGKLQPRVYESRGAIWQSSFQCIGTEEQNSGGHSPMRFSMAKWFVVF